MAHIEATPRISATTLAKYIRKITDTTMRKSVLLGLLQSKGRVTYNHGGKKVTWPVEYKERTPVAGAGTPNQITFAPTTTQKWAELPWRTYTLGERITKFEKLVQQGKDVTLIKIVTDVAEKITKNMMSYMKKELFIDGNATGYTRRLHGLESCMGVNGLISNSVCGDPNDSYASLTTNLGTYGGSWTGDTGDGWPTGTGDPQYCFFSPVVVDYNHATYFGSDSDTWKENAQYAMNYLCTIAENLHEQKYDLILLTAKMMRQFRDSLKSAQTVEVTQNSELTKLGHPSIQYMGTEISFEYGVPTGVGYALTLDKMELMSMQGGLIEKETDEDITTQSTLIALDAWVQLKMESPAFFGKLSGISTAGT